MNMYGKLCYERTFNQHTSHVRKVKFIARDITPKQTRYKMRRRGPLISNNRITIFPQLKEISLVVQHAIWRNSHWSLVSWVKGLRPIVEIFAEHLPDDIHLQVYIVSKPEAIELLNTYLQRRYKIV